jgi:type IV pilus assembly protein PilW
MTGPQHQQGFTLIEVLVAMVCSSLMIAALYQVFHSQQRSFMKQDDVTEMQQNLRAGLYLMTKDILSAGFDPNKTANAGFVTDFDPAIFDTDIDYTLDTNIIAFTMDADGDGIIQANDNEQIAYRLQDNNLERFSVSRNAWEPIANNIDALNFVYLDSDGNVTINPTAFKAIEVSLLVRTGDKDLKYTNARSYKNKQGADICPACNNDHYRHRLLSTTIRIRNL